MDRAPQLNADAWVDQYGDALFHFASARVKDRAIAEDLVQESFLAAVQSQERYKGQSIDGLSTGEICSLLDITENNCWVILYRARMLLRKCLELVGDNPHAEGHEP